jgi:hypothetical protein
LGASKAGRKSLKRYELTNLLFFLCIIAALAILVTFVFRFYGTRNEMPSEEADMGVVSDSLGVGSDVGIFYLGTKLSEVNLQYRSRLDIPSTDDGLVRDLFSLAGVEEITINQKMIMLRKTTSSRWESIQPGVRRIVRTHLHIHY